MRSALLLILLCACGGPQGDVTEPTADPVTSTTSEPTATPAATADASSGPADKPPPEDESEWTIEKGDANGVTLSNAGATLTLKTLGWTSSLRKTKPIGNKSITSANVSFATVTADDVVATDVVCALPAWPDFPNDPLTLASTLVPLVMKDAVPAAAITKVKPALLACAGGKQLRVEWEFKESKLVSSKVDGADAKTNTCVKKALANAFMMDSGVCAATLAP